ncbi:hypothetical protein P7C73_g5277, partial [Tremellales sp. Uapishka_1]
MSSSDWWTQSTSSLHTPQRPLTRSRFAPTPGDELDPEDARMADSIQFLPSFANSPAGKLALGTSPASASSPPPQRRSPTARFNSSLTGGAESSPRNSRNRTITSQLVDDEMPPTTSLRDSVDTPTRAVSAPAT